MGSITASVKLTSAFGSKHLTPRKRVLRACDKCRLYRARCDGQQACQTCHRYDRVCEYNVLPEGRTKTTVRIRALENSLVKARKHIADLQSQLPKDQPIVSPPTASSLLDTIRIAQEPALSTTASTGIAFVEALLKPLSHHEDIRQWTRTEQANDILCHSIVDTRPFYTSLCQLPVHGTMLEIVSDAFISVFGLSNIILEQEFFVAAQGLYETPQASYTREHADFVPLFFAVVALGVLHYRRLPRHPEYEDNLKESLFYFTAASSTLDLKEECLSLPKLQASLAIVLYLINTSKLDHARLYLRTITSSSTVRKLLRGTVIQGFEAQSLTFTTTKNIVWLIYYLDMHVSNLLGLRLLLDCPTSTLTTIYAINTAAYNVANYRRSDKRFLSEVSLAMAVELLRLVQRMNPERLVVNADVDASLSAEMSPSEDTRNHSQLQIELATWEYMFHAIFPDDDTDPRIALAHNELQLHYYMAQIVLFHRYRTHHSLSTITDISRQVNDVHNRQACVAAATNAISHTSNRLERMQMTSLTWLSAYTVLISTITLLVATASLDNASVHVRSAMESTVQAAARILNHTTYYASSQGRRPYMDLIETASAKLNIALEPMLSNNFAMAADESRYTGENTGPGYPTQIYFVPVSSKQTSHNSWWPSAESNTMVKEWAFD